MNATAVVPNDQGCSLFTVAVCACSINTASASSTGYPITSLSLLVCHSAYVIGGREQGGVNRSGCGALL